MNNDEFEAKMRSFEDSNDPRLHPEMYVVVRIDGRKFSTLTRGLKPFDEDLQHAIKMTMWDIMTNSGFKCIYGYTQSDEMSFIIDPLTSHINFKGKIRKYNSLLAAHASAAFTQYYGKFAIFDCRTIQFPNEQLVADYFIWRMADCETNCLNKWCYHALINRKMSPLEVATDMEGKGFDWKNETLFYSGINFNEIPTWQKRGIGAEWVIRTFDGKHGKTGEPIKYERNQLEFNYNLPKNKAEYHEYIVTILMMHQFNAKVDGFKEINNDNTILPLRD